MNLARFGSNRSKQRIEAHARTDVKEYFSALHLVRNEPLQGIFITAEPAAMDVRAYNPFFSSQRTLQDGHSNIAWNGTEW
jgi:hypothetical protein